MRWLPGTRILTWVGDGAGTSDASVAGLPGAAPGDVARPNGAERRGLQAGDGAEAELVEPAAEIVGAATHHRGEHPEVVVADREHLAVEVLALQLDRRRVPRDHGGVGVVDLVEPHEVDGEALARRSPTAR